MEKLNMANMNTLFKKGYLLAGVIMAANMFAVNEMKASAKLQGPGKNENKGDTYVDDNLLDNPYQQMGQNFISPTQANVPNSNNIPFYLLTDQKTSMQTVPLKSSDFDQDKCENNPSYKKFMGKKGKKGVFDSLLSKVLTYEDAINLIGGLALSGANNYFKWWDYNPGKYGELGCIGWRSKRLLDIFQFEVNLNLGRGAGWTFLYILDLFSTKPKGKKTIKVEIKDDETSKKTSTNFTKYIFNCSRGFVSAPLTVHFSNFSISISLDSIIWGIVGMILDKKDGKKLKENQQNPLIKQLIIESDDTETKKNSKLMTKEELTEEEKKNYGKN